MSTTYYALEDAVDDAVDATERAIATGNTADIRYAIAHKRQTRILKATTREARLVDRIAALEAEIAALTEVTT